MYRLLFGSIVVCWAAAAAAAAQRPEVGPPAAWVRPVVGPLAETAPTQAAIKILLQDEQLNFAPAADEAYYEKILRIQTPQGLDDLGTISLPWDPDTETLRVHKFEIRRGARVIDLLGDGRAFTILRRENNLEGAALDGVLTAAIEPAGLQVGDVIDLAYTYRQADPALGGHAERIAGGWTNAPIDHLRFRAHWTGQTPLQWRANDAVAGLKEVRGAEGTDLLLTLDGIEPLVQPNGAPPRFQQGRQIDFSGWGSWAQLAGRFAPFYDAAARLAPDSPLRAEIARIRGASTDKRAQAAAALALVQDQVHYVFLGMNDGGLVPAAADLTWSRRFGDCKGKTVLLLALLHALEIDAQPVLVSTTNGDGLDTRLPMVGVFDHVLVRAMIGGTPYWLDGTRVGDRRLEDIAVPPFIWGLPLVAQGAALVRLTPTPPTRPLMATAIRIDASAGLAVPAPFHVETVLRGDSAIDLKLQFADLTPAELDRGLRDYWLKRYDFVGITAVSARFDEATGEEHLGMDGMATMDWSGNRYETDGLVLGLRAHFNRFAGPHQDAPFAVNFPVYTQHSETILLPYGGARFTVDGDDIDMTVAGTKYWRRARIVNGVFTAEATARSLQPEFPASEAPAAARTLRNMAKGTIYLRAPDHYVLTDAEVAAARARTLTSEADFLDRGAMLLDHSDFDHAIADFDHAIALNPKNGTAFAGRGMAYTWKGDLARARHDIDAAFLLESSNPLVFRARGYLALEGGDIAGAIAALTTSLDMEPGNAFALLARARAYEKAGDDDRELADTAEIISQRQDMVMAYLMRANAYMRRHQKDEALHEVDVAVAANPASAYAYTVKGLVDVACDKNDAARAAFDRAVELEPTAQHYLKRAQYRAKSDIAGRRADIDAALRHDPRSADALSMRASMQYDQGAYADAAATLAAAIAIDGSNFRLLVDRGAAYARAHQPALAEKDFVAARALASSAGALNDLCWRQATAGVALAGALSACDAALAKAPAQPNYLDSRGFALLRLSRYDEAIAAYTAALKLRPDSPYSLYGRGIARRRRGDARAGGADISAALAANADLAREFASYGVVP